MTQEQKTRILSGLFIGSLVLANTIGTKITTILGIRMSVGIFFMPILFLVTDIIGDVYGRKRARELVFLSIGVLVFSLIMIFIAIKLPANETWGNQKAFETIFSSTLRMTAASIAAFIISQLHDVWVFDFIKRRTSGKHLWLRNNLSTIISQFIDTTIFMFLAFYHMAPKFNAAFIFSLIVPYWIAKVIFALLDTPLCYLGIHWLKNDIDRPEKTTLEPVELHAEV